MGINSSKKEILRILENSATNFYNRNYKIKYNYNYHKKFNLSFYGQFFIQYFFYVNSKQKNFYHN